MTGWSRGSAARRAAVSWGGLWRWVLARWPARLTAPKRATKAWEIDVRADFKGLPSASESVAQGRRARSGAVTIRT
ncbi:MAG TPA: hypothetical protein VF319_05415 [Caldimonas sp.]